MLTMATLSQSQLVALAISAGLSQTNAQLAAAVAMAESGGRTDAVNATAFEYSVGLWQINLYAHPQYTTTGMEDPTQNAKAMAAISNRGTTWGAWGAYTNGSYRQFYTVVSPSALPVSQSTQLSSSGFASLSSSVRTNPATLDDVGSAWKYVLAYIVVILIFTFIAKFEAGYTALYYLAVLFLLMLFVTQSAWIANAIAPITQANQQTTV